jgi:hypothetical protein
LARNAKNPEKTFGFLAERTGTEHFDVFPMFLKSSKGVLADDSTCGIDSIGAKTNCDLTPARADETIGEVLPVTKTKN